MSKNKYIQLASHAKDLTGQRFGRLVVLGPIGHDSGGKIMWECLCDCQNIVVVQGGNLRQKFTQSCGCLHKNMMSRKFKTHGMAGSPLYRIWQNIIERCFKPTNESYKNYGGRGITICDEWRHDFQAFYDHVSKLEHYGENGYSIDRINNLTGNYEPGNLRFATATEQSRNRRTNHMITYEGETKCLSDWTDSTGIHKPTIYRRIKQQGWSMDRALNETPKPNKRGILITYNGKTQGLSSWARELNIDRQTLVRRLKSGWTEAEVVSTPKRATRQFTKHKLLTFDGKTQTVTAWSRELGISIWTIYARLHRNIPIEQVLSQVIKTGPNTTRKKSP